MLLVIDIGNTNIAFGLFKGRRLVKKTMLATASFNRYCSFVQKLKNGLMRRRLKAIVICSVVPKAENALLKVLAGLFGIRPLVLGKNITVPMKNLYKNPKQVGQDRLAAAYAGYKLYGGGRPLIVIDFGTAVTFDVVSKYGAYLGGLIAPGLEMSLKALSAKAALLPKVKLGRPSFILGKTTKDSMRSGSFYGCAAMCDGLTARLERRLRQKFNVVATGGTARLVAPISFSIKRVDDNLVLKGVNAAFFDDKRRCR